MLNDTLCSTLVLAALLTLGPAVNAHACGGGSIGQPSSACTQTTGSGHSGAAAAAAAPCAGMCAGLVQSSSTGPLSGAVTAVPHDSPALEPSGRREAPDPYPPRRTTV